MRFEALLEKFKGRVFNDLDEDIIDRLKESGVISIVISLRGTLPCSEVTQGVVVSFHENPYEAHNYINQDLGNPSKRGRLLYTTINIDCRND